MRHWLRDRYQNVPTRESGVGPSTSGLDARTTRFEGDAATFGPCRGATRQRPSSIAPPPYPEASVMTGASHLSGLVVSEAELALGMFTPLTMRARPAPAPARRAATGEWPSLVRRLTLDQEIGGSNPPSPANPRPSRLDLVWTRPPDRLPNAAGKPTEGRRREAGRLQIRRPEVVARARRGRRMPPVSEVFAMTDQRVLPLPGKPAGAALSDGT